MTSNLEKVYNGDKNDGSMKFKKNEINLPV